MLKPTVTLLAAILLFAGCKSSDKPVLLRLNMKKGETFTLISKISTDVQSMSLNTEEVIKLSVDSADNNEMVLVGDVISIKSESDMMGEKESYNSDKKTEEMTADELEMHGEFTKILNSNFHFKVNNRGQLTRGMTYQDGQTLASEENPFDLDNFFISFPEKEIKVGDTWEEEKTSAFLDIKSVFVYKIKEINNNEVIISVTKNIGPIKGINQGNTATGDYIIDRSTGRLLKGSLVMQMQSGLGGGKATYSFETK
ncbi:MAG TPA: DUF6263 family protein [Bacteroidia bacterium]|nr:DUF6263 family protein [Bacteroidia bacterium]